MKNGSIKKLIVIVPIFVVLALLALCIIDPMEMEETTKGKEDNEENSGIKWEMEDGGTLHIYGNGNMDNYYGQYLAPWDEYKKGIQKIVSGSLTAICGKSGSYAEAYAAEHGYAFEEK